VEIDGEDSSRHRGGHWRGMFINAYDMARFGYLFLRKANGDDRAIVSESDANARTPGPAKRTTVSPTGFNTGRKPLRRA